MKLNKLFDLLIRKFIPIKKNRIVFLSYNGHCCDSPMYIYKKMSLLAPDLDYIWLVDEKHKCDLPADTNYYLIGSREAFYAYYSARAIIDNVYGSNESYLTSNKLTDLIKYKLKSFFNYKRKQHIYSTWHGSPFKKMGRDLPNSNIIDFSRPNLTMIFNDFKTKDIMSYLTFNRANYEVLSSPRNDILHENDINYIDNIKRNLNIPLKKKVVLFAPTFRAKVDVLEKDVMRSGINQLNMIDFNKLFNILNYKFGGDWIFVCRFHYHVSQMVNWKELEMKYGDKIINGNKSEEMSEYLLCSDLLISDVSSCLIDFSVTAKPSFIFFPDFDYYQKHERGGFYYDIKNLPFPFAVSVDDLLDNIKEFNVKTYLKKINRFKNEIGFDYDSNSSEKYAKYILDDLKIKY